MSFLPYLCMYVWANYARNKVVCPWACRVNWPGCGTFIKSLAKFRGPNLFNPSDFWRRRASPSHRSWQGLSKSMQIRLRGILSWGKFPTKSEFPRSVTQYRFTFFNSQIGVREPLHGRSLACGRSFKTVQIGNHPPRPGTEWSDGILQWHHRGRDCSRNRGF